MRTVIVDDQTLIRGLLRECCATRLGHEVVGEAGSGRDAVSVVLQTQPELLLLDLRLPDMSGFQILHIIRQSNFCPRSVLFVSAYCTDLTVFLVEQVKAQGFLDKVMGSVENLCAAIKEVAAGHDYWSRSFTEIRTLRHKDPNAFEKMLSEREITVLTMFAALLSDEEIANRLEISQDTVVKHRANIYRKLDVQSKLDLMRYARDHGFSDSDLLVTS